MAAILARLGLTIVGQSNELGSGENNDTNMGVGSPMRDPIAPSVSTRRSMWPRLAQKLGERGVALSVFNGAVGGTSISKQWVGQVLAWQSGMKVVYGSLILASGGLWRRGDAFAATLTSTVIPTGTADTTGADSVQWIYLGVPVAGIHVAGRVLRPGDAYFDPIGHLGKTYVGIQNWIGYDAKIALISFGQTDADTLTTRSEFAAGIISVTDYFLANGIKVIIGFSCYSNIAGADAWYTSQLIPGWNDAVRYYSGNPNVFRGANLRTALGVLSSSPQTGKPGLRDDYHMNDLGYALASDEWDRVFGNIGIF